ncbi:hypothetical protein [Eggerthella timonensis]|uniref:hypothetical protein n=1 Tax=Eggerthella timonensis TaxID=1871008 RepID=UPI0011AF6A8B|nr:hypothetical protein [Eggerthella timonensis]
MPWNGKRRRRRSCARKREGSRSAARRRRAKGRTGKSAAGAGAKRRSKKGAAALFPVPSRDRYERIAALFLQGYDVVDVPVRFDIVSIVVIAPDRAMIRHHINAFGAQ